MKKRILLATLLLVSFASGVFAQDYKATLAATYKAFNEAKDAQEKLNQSNRFGLIAKKFNTEWTAAYYAAWSKILLNYDEKDNTKKDALLDDADEMLTSAASLSDKSNKAQQSEIHALTAMAANARIGVDPMKRWKKYGKVFEDNLENAKKENEANPRIYFLKGTSLFYTPKMFGGGKKNALEYFDKADGYFAKETGGDILTPSWGKEVNAEYIKMCKTED